LESKNRFLKRLEEIGLTSYEARVYMALLGRNSFSAAQASIESGIPRQRVYDVLRSLTQKGFCVAKPGRVQKFSAADPGVAIPGLIQRGKEAALEAVKNSEIVGNSLIPDLRLYYEEGQKEINPLEYIEVMKDRNQIANKFRQLERGAKREIQLLVRPPYVIYPPTVNLEKLKDKGISVKGVYEIAERENPELFSLIETQVQKGEEVRFVEKLPTKMALFDGKIAMLHFKDPVKAVAFTTLVIDHPDLGLLLNEAFYAIWNGATPYEELE